VPVPGVLLEQDTGRQAADPAENRWKVTGGS
jgi:hypothetical protein